MQGLVQVGAVESENQPISKLCYRFIVKILVGNLLRELEKLMLCLFVCFQDVLKNLKALSTNTQNNFVEKKSESNLFLIPLEL